MPSAPRQLTVIGDSGVYGWGDREGGGWCERLRQLDANPGSSRGVRTGVRGDGLENVAQRWEQRKARGELRRQTPGGLLLSVGLNDSAKVGRRDGRSLLSADAYRFGVEQLIGAMAPQTQVMVLGLTPVDEHPMPFADCLWYDNAAISIYEAQLEEACLEPTSFASPPTDATGAWLAWLDRAGWHSPQCRWPPLDSHTVDALAGVAELGWSGITDPGHTAMELMGT